MGRGLDGCCTCASKYLKYIRNEVKFIKKIPKLIFNVFKKYPVGQVTKRAEAWMDVALLLEHSEIYHINISK